MGDDGKDEWIFVVSCRNRYRVSMACSGNSKIAPEGLSRPFRRHGESE